MPAMVIGNIDFDYLVTSSVSLTLTGSRKVRAKPVSFIFSHTLQLIGMEFDMMFKLFMLNILIPSLSEMY